LDTPLDFGPNHGELTPEVYKLKQQNVQLQHLLKYKDDVEIPTLKRQMGHFQHELQTTKAQLNETVKQEDFIDRQSGIIHIDRDMRVVKINSYALEILGTLHTQAIGRPIKEVGIHSQSGRPIFGDIDYYLEPEGKESEWEKEIPMPNGEKRYYHFRSALINGTRLISIHEVTDLRLSESRVKAIIGSSKDGIALVDEGSVIRSTNARFGKLFGLNWRQFAGMQFDIAAELLQHHFTEAHEFMTFYGAIQKEPQLHAEQIFEMVLPHSATYQIYTRPIVDEQSRLIGRVWFVTDVSQFKEMEKKLVANAADLEVKVKARTEELYVQNQELVRVRQETEMELDMAKQVQQGMLPKTLPRLEGYEVGAAYAPTGKVSGDFYDFIQLDGDRIFMLMTDVSGHGVPAALVTAMAKMAFDRHVKSGLSVAQILTNVNVDLCAAINTDHYLTAFAGILDLRTGRLIYSRVCHPYPVVYRHETRTLEHLQMRGGFFLGMFEDNSYTEQETVLNPGDLLFVYTDGINESFNSKDELYGRKRLDAVIKKFAPMGASETIAQAQMDKERFSEGRQSLDDISIFAIKRREPR
jgi:PAS domain S-box-containing protein